MNDQELLRYSRHILLDDFGIEGQERLLSSSAIVFGVGGLGCAAAMYLALSGVKKITLVDNDKVEITNLQRQILHTINSLGQNKTHSAKHMLSLYNKDVQINAIPEIISGSILYDYVRESDVVLDCTDNFSSRYSINKVCVRTSTPLVSGSAINFSGQISVYDLRDICSPCYNCLFPEKKEAEDINCANMGILSPIVGIIGSLQAAEAIRILAKMTFSGLTNNLLIFNIIDMDIRKLKIHRDHGCDICCNR